MSYGKVVFLLSVDRQYSEEGRSKLTPSERLHRLRRRWRAGRLFQPERDGKTAGHHSQTVLDTVKFGFEIL